jgi:glutamate synthase domain-containing protein 2
MSLRIGSRFSALYICAALTLAGFAMLAGGMPHVAWIAWPALALTLLGLRDLLQTRHSIRRNYPILGNLRFFFEFIRPELRQYIVESDTEARPFSRNQRSIVYQRAKKELDKVPFGTQLDLYEAGSEWITHSMVPAPVQPHDFRVAVGGEGCSAPYSASVFNISALSFGALSANAILALNRGARAGGFAHDTGEGGISRYHRENGGDLVWEIGSGYFGCRTPDARFDPERFAEQARQPQVKMVEIKLSQGAKPGHGGVLPGAKVSPEIAQARGVPARVDCISPARHSEFSTPIGLLEFVARLRELSGGKPVGFKLCVGHPWELFAITKAMLATGITPDFITVDGAEGGTGAAPAEFVDHVGMPLQEGLLLVHNTLVGLNLRDRIKIGASGKVISAFDIARTLAIGADWCNSARGFMFALGCVQAQHCHLDTCPSGVATQDPLRMRALVVPDKAERVASFHRNTLKALSELIAAAGLTHPNQLEAHHIVQRVSHNDVRLLSHLLPFLKPGALLDGASAEHFPHKVYEVWWPKARAESFSIESASTG